MKPEWVYTALDKVKNNYRIDNHWIDDEKADDLEGKIRLIIDNQHIRWNVVVKNELRNYQLEQIQDLAFRHKPLMIIARRIFPKIKNHLREYEIAYLEGNGNIFLKKGKTYIFIDANKPLEPEKALTYKVFTTTGLRLIFEILQDKALVNQPYRLLAEKAQIGLGNVNNIMNGLKDQGYLIKLKKDELKLMRKKELYEKWIDLYPEKLKPGLKIGTFRFLRDDDFKNWKTIDLIRGKIWWGGEPAGDLLTNYLRPEILTIYTKENRNELIRHLRIVPDENGYIEIYHTFWDTDDTTTLYVPTWLVYADLMNTGDRRCIETAKKLYDEQLSGQF